MGSMRESLTLANKIVATAKKELAKERETNLTKRAKELLQDIQEAKRTVSLLEKQLENFMREIATN
jgi:hypothetical protein